MPSAWRRNELPMSQVLDVLTIVSDTLEASQLPFMLTGSFALGLHARPRRTRDLNFGVALKEQHVDLLLRAFSADFHIDEYDAPAAAGYEGPRSSPARACRPISDQGFSQFSTARRGTRRNSRSLFVTTVAPMCRACEAISMS